MNIFWALPFQNLWIIDLIRYPNRKSLPVSFRTFEIDATVVYFQDLPVLTQNPKTNENGWRVNCTISTTRVQCQLHGLGRNQHQWKHVRSNRRNWPKRRKLVKQNRFFVLNVYFEVSVFSSFFFNFRKRKKKQQTIEWYFVSRCLFRSVEIMSLPQRVLFKV